jgi:hypothetical protein
MLNCEGRVFQNEEDIHWKHEEGNVFYGHSKRTLAEVAVIDQINIPTV